MKQIAKYNLFKSLSLLVSCVPTLAVALSYSPIIVNNSGASVSVVAIMGMIIAALCLKNKIAENWKLPSAFVISTAIFVLIIVIEKVLLPVKFTCLACMISCGVDELSFKRIYSRLEFLMPEKAKFYKHFGFYFCKSETLGELSDE